MPRTPDRSPGPLIEDEEIQLGDNPGAPSVVGGIRYDSTVSGGSFQMRDATGTFNPRSSGSSGLPQEYGRAPIVLDSSVRSLKAKLDAAPSTQWPIVASYADIVAGVETGASANTVTNSSTLVTVVAGPSSGVRLVRSFSICNVGDANRILTVLYDDNGTERELIVAQLEPDESLAFEDGEGLFLVDARGWRRVNVS